MKTAFDKKLHSVALRHNLNLFLQSLGWTLLLAGMIAILAVAIQRTLAVELVSAASAGTLLAAALAAAWAWWLTRRPDALQVAVVLDTRLGLKERFSTALALAGSDDPFARSSSEEAHRRAANLDLTRNFPIRINRRWAYAAACWVAALGMLAFLPQFDVAGLFAAQQQEQQKAKDAAQAKADVKEALAQVQASVKELGNPELAKELAKLNDLKAPESPEDMRRQTLGKLEDVAKKVSDLKEKNGLEKAPAMKEMLQQLKNFPGAVSTQLNPSLAKGDFKAAAEALKKMQQDLDKSALTDDQKKKLQEQLEDLSKQMGKLANDNRPMEDELAKSGLDKSLAKLKPEDLEKALKNQGVDPEKVKELVKQAQACEGAKQASSKLGQALAKAAGGGGGLSQEGMSDAAGQLSDLENLQQQLNANEATMQDIKNAMAKMGGKCPGNGNGEGEGNGEGQGNGSGRGKGNGGDGAGQWAAGDPEGSGNGSGGPGRGRGGRATDPDGPTRSTMTKAPTPVGEGPMIASTFIKGQQIKGESTKEFSAAVEAAKDSAAQAINDNEIPKKYEGAIKDYYNGFNKAGDKK